MAKPVYALVNGVWTLVGSTTAHNHTVADVTGLQAALDAKADVASPTFTGTLTADVIKITGGTPGVGKVLTSDADGDATWEVATGLIPSGGATGATLQKASGSDYDIEWVDPAYGGPAVTWIGQTSSYNSGTISTPANIQSGDLLLVTSYHKVDSTVGLTYSGAATPTQLVMSSNPYGTVWYVWSDGSAQTFTQVTDASERGISCIALRNVDPTTPFQTGTPIEQTLASGTSHTLTGIAANNGTVAVYFWIGSDDNSPTLSSANNAWNTVYQGNANSFGSSAVAYRAVGAAITLEDLTVTLAQNGPDGAAALKVIVQPDLSGTTPPDGHEIQDEGVALPQRSNIDFTGAGVTVTDDSGNDKTVVTVPGGIQQTLFDAKGDLIVASAADTAARLAAGTDGQVLTADSAEGTGLKWVSLPSTPTGVTVVQVLEAQASIWTADVQTNVTAAVDDVIAVYAVWEGAASPTYSVASPGLTFTQQAMTGVATTGIGLWTAPVTAASTYTITGSISANDGGTTHSVQVALIRGANPSNPMDVTPILGTVSGTSWSLGSITTTNSSMIIAAAAGYGTVDAITGPSGWTNNDLQQGLTHTRMLSYKGQTNAGASESITMTIGYSQAGRYILAAFRPAGVYDPITEGFIDAKGDLIAGTAADTAARLPAGTDGQILVADSAESTGLKWIDTSVITPSYSADLGAITGGVPVTITHNLNTYDVVVQILEKDVAGAGGAAGTVTDATVEITSANAVDITFVGNAVANLYRVTVVAVGGTGSGGVGAVQTYTPALTATVTDPVIGTGGARAGSFGRYWRNENRITAEIGICFGSTGASAGSGIYIISLPVPQRTPVGVEGVALGNGGIYDTSAGAWRAVTCVRSTDTTFNVYYESANTVITNNAPWTWAAGDQISLQITYEAA